MIVDVTELGARGDGAAIDSAAVNEAIGFAAGRGGGIVAVPAGRYLCYSIRLRSNITLQLHPGAELVAAAPAGEHGYDPPEPFPGPTYQDFGHSHWHNSLIWGESLHDVVIRGPGVIDGAALHYGDAPGVGHANKAIALKRCRNVVVSELTILRGGHFAILATGVDNLRIEGLLVDTNRDGIDVDCCRNVRITGCTVNSPNDDAIVFKSSYALGEVRDVLDVTVSDCLVSGYDVGSVANASYTRATASADDGDPPTGRIKFGTESNGGFRNVTIANVVFDRCRGIALETVDGGAVEDVAISNVTMRDTSNPPLFLRIGSRLRAPEGTGVGSLRRVSVSNLVVSGADARMPVIVAGLPDHPVEDVSLSDVRVVYRGGLSMDDAAAQTPRHVNTFFVDSTGPRPDPYDVPERAADYPEPCVFGVLPAYALYARHVTGLRLSGVDVRFEAPDTRPPIVLDDVTGADLRLLTARTTGDAPAVILRDVADLECDSSVSCAAEAEAPQSRHDRSRRPAARDLPGPPGGGRAQQPR